MAPQAELPRQRQARPPSERGSGQVGRRGIAVCPAHPMPRSGARRSTDHLRGLSRCIISPVDVTRGSYKQATPTSKALRRRIVDQLVEQGLDVGGFGETLVASDDDLDAVVSALTAALAFTGQTDPPPPHLEQLSKSEGWIHVPSMTALDLEALNFA